ncbi:MAG: hypothetical protein WCC25_15960 [Candidatus Korobacteraceae bacterium]
MNGFEPWVKNPDLTRSRLSTIASIIRNVRHEAVLLHEPQNGDDAWSLGCRAYARTRDAIKKAAGTYDWLKILPETTWLGFSFAIGASPCRFYRGDPEEPPYHYQSKSYGEIHQIQLCLDLDQGFPPVDGVLRLAVETDGSGEVLAVTLVEVDKGGNAKNSWQIPVDPAQCNVISIQTPPVEFPPVVAEPLEKLEDEKRKRNDGIGSVS